MTTVSQPIVHSTQNMEFPKEMREQIAAARGQRQQRHAQPQAPTARAIPQHTPNMQPQSQAPSIPVAANPAIDPMLTAMVQGKGAPGVYHNPMNPQHAAAQHGMHNPSPSAGAGTSYGPGPQAGGQAAPQWYETPRPTAANVDAPVVRNPMPGFVVPLADSNGTSVALPSRFAYYGFKDLYVVPFKNAHLAKLQRAHTEQSLQPIVEVVSSVVYTSTPGYKNVAFELTMPDFFFVLYWLRMNSFTKTSFIHKTKCTNEEHVEKVNNGLMKKDTLEIKRIIDKTTLVTHELEEMPDPSVFSFGQESDIVFSPPRMRDVLEFLDHPLMSDANTRIEFSYLAQQASHIQSMTQYLNLDQRIGIVENFDLDQVALVKQFEKLVKAYGVEESINVTCKGCGASRESTISLDASSFLSFE